MDLVKIGAYIAGKRKALGLTQKELAQQLGKSDKSVSKWERGICLPDVSIYTDLCNILGITLNEFLAGEDLARENVISKSEENIIGVATDSKHRQNHLKRIIRILAASLMAAALAAGAIFLQAHRSINEIAPLPEDSIEAKTAEMLTGTGGCYSYSFTTTDDYTSLKIYLSQYHEGTLESRSEMEAFYGDTGSPENGNILIVPDAHNSTLKVIVADQQSRSCAELPLLPEEPHRQAYARTAGEIPGTTDIAYNREQPLMGLIYGKDEVKCVDVWDMMEENADALAMNEYVYFISFEFCK